MRRRAGGGDAGVRERARRLPATTRVEATAPEANASSGLWPLRARASGGRRPGPSQTSNREGSALRERFREAPVGFERIAELLVAGRVMGARHQQRVALTGRA